jgi:hypothetical protein
MILPKFLKGSPPLLTPLQGNEHVAALLYGEGAADSVLGTVIGGEFRLNSKVSGKSGVRGMGMGGFMREGDHDEERKDSKRKGLSPIKISSPETIQHNSPEFLKNLSPRQRLSQQQNSLSPIIKNHACERPLAELSPKTLAILKHPDPDLVELARCLIDIDTVSGHEAAMAEALLAPKWALRKLEEVS